MSKARLKQIQQEKKRLSKLVGIAIRENNGDADELKQQVKIISEEISLIKSALSIAQQTTTEKPRALPPQFSPRANFDTKAEEIIQITHPDIELWENYISNHPNATAYHSLAAKTVIENVFKKETRYLLAISDNREACGALPLCHMQSRLFGDFWCSLPYFNYGGVIADNPRIAQQLLDYAAALKPQSSAYIEYRHSLDISELPKRTDKCAMLLQLPEKTDELWQQIGTKVRAQIKKAQSFNLHTVHGRHELVDEFYQVFSINMRDLGTPVYTKELFTEMLNQFPSAGITVVKKGNKAIAAGFTLGWRNTLEIPWASTLRSANTYNANMLLYWEILSRAVCEGYQIFDFGRSSKDASTYKFKKQWGAEPHQLYWHYQLKKGELLPELNPNNAKYRLMINTWKKLPLFMANRVGPHIVKHLP